MKLTCPISQLTYHTSSGYGTGSAIHPALTQPVKQLLNNLPSYYSGRIAQDSSDSLYLYRLAWLCKLPDITFRVPVDRASAEPHLTGLTEQVIKLVTTVSDYRHIAFPSLIIDRDTCDLATLRFYLESLSECVAEAQRSGRELSAVSRLNRLESTLERLALSQLKAHRTRTSRLIAEWAALAADFPEFRVTIPATSELVTCSQYWQTIITASFVENTNYLLSLNIPVSDLDELIEHCEDYIPHGTTYARVLMKSLRAARHTISEMLSPVLVAKALTRDSENRSASATRAKPTRAQFSTNLEYIRAVAAWQKEALAVKYTSIDL